MIGRVHITPTTVASRAMANPPMPHRMKMPRRSRLLSGTASALGLPLLAHELLADVPLELAEVVVAAPDLGRPEVLDGRVVLAGHLAELLHGARVRPRQPLLALGDPRRRLDQL